MKISALTTVWGNYIDMFLNGTVKSLALDENREAMSDVKWNIFTEESNFQKIDTVIADLLPDVEVKYRDLSTIRDRVDYLHCALIWQIKECLAQRTRMLLLPPDSIFGNKTIPNLFKIGKEPGACVVSPHPRVLPGILNEDFTSNQSLVRLAWKHLHRSWTDSEVGHDRQNSYIGGVAWEYLDPKTISVKHLLPTPYFCDFTEADLQFFETQPGIGAIDHVWPSALVQAGRLKYVGSSDACFVVEITDGDKNLPAAPLGQDQTKFWQAHPHNVFNQQIACIFRSE